MVTQLPQHSTVTDTVRAEVADILDYYRLPGLTAADRFCDQHPADVVAFRFIEGSLTEHAVTFGDLADRSRRIASVLHEMGIGPGDRVATLMGKSSDLPAIILGIWRLGAVYLPLFTAFGRGAVDDRLTRSRAKVVIAAEEQMTKVPKGEWTTVSADGSSLHDNLRAHADRADPWCGQPPLTGPDVPLVHMFTSGTTGKPKAVIHSTLYVAGWESYARFGLGLTPEDVFWCAADPGWAFGLYLGIVTPLAIGHTSVQMLGTFDPEPTWQALDRYQITNFAAAPTALRALRTVSGTRTLPALTKVSSAGEPLTPDVLDWSASLGFPVHDHFGQTELGMVAGFPHHPDISAPVQPRAMGVSFPGWVLQVLKTDSDEPAPSGTIGRLAIEVGSSPLLTFTGYGDDRDQPGDRFSDDRRYYLTGDLAQADEAGVLRFAGRADDIILMSGYRIGPVDVESCLIRHPAVREAAVVAAPDAARGEIVHAFVVPGTGVTADDNLVLALQTWVKNEYAAHAYPRQIDFVDRLPRTESGKVIRSQLRRLLQEDK